MDLIEQKKSEQRWQYSENVKNLNNLTKQQTEIGLKY